MWNSFTSHRSGVPLPTMFFHEDGVYVDREETSREKMANCDVSAANDSLTRGGEEGFSPVSPEKESHLTSGKK